MRINDLPENIRKKFSISEAQEIVRLNDCVFPVKDEIGPAAVQTNGISRIELFSGFALMGFISTGLLNNGVTKAIIREAIIAGKLLVQELDEDFKVSCAESEQNAK